MSGLNGTYDMGGNGVLLLLNAVNALEAELYKNPDNTPKYPPYTVNNCQLGLPLSVDTASSPNGTNTSIVIMPLASSGRYAGSKIYFTRINGNEFGPITIPFSENETRLVELLPKINDARLIDIQPSDIIDGDIPAVVSNEIEVNIVFNSNSLMYIGQFPVTTTLDVVPQTLYITSVFVLWVGNSQLFPWFPNARQFNGKSNLNGNIISIGTYQENIDFKIEDVDVRTEGSTISVFNNDLINPSWIIAGYFDLNDDRTNMTITIDVQSNVDRGGYYVNKILQAIKISTTIDIDSGEYARESTGIHVTCRYNNDNPSAYMSMMFIGLRKIHPRGVNVEPFFISLPPPQAIDAATAFKLAPRLQVSKYPKNAILTVSQETPSNADIFGFDFTGPHQPNDQGDQTSDIDVISEYDHSLPEIELRYENNAIYNYTDNQNPILLANVSNGQGVIVVTFIKNDKETTDIILTSLTYQNLTQSPNIFLTWSYDDVNDGTLGTGGNLVAIKTQKLMLPPTLISSGIAIDALAPEVVAGRITADTLVSEYLDNLGNTFIAPDNSIIHETFTLPLSGSGDYYNRTLFFGGITAPLGHSGFQSTVSNGNGRITESNQLSYEYSGDDGFNYANTGIRIAFAQKPMPDTAVRIDTSLSLNKELFFTGADLLPTVVDSASGFRYKTRNISVRIIYGISKGAAVGYLCSPSNPDGELIYWHYQSIHNGVNVEFNLIHYENINDAADCGIRVYTKPNVDNIYNNDQYTGPLSQTPILYDTSNSNFPKLQDNGSVESDGRELFCLGNIPNAGVYGVFDVNNIPDIMKFSVVINKSSLGYAAWVLYQDEYVDKREFNYGSVARNGYCGLVFDGSRIPDATIPENQGRAGINVFTVTDYPGDYVITARNQAPYIDGIPQFVNDVIYPCVLAPSLVLSDPGNNDKIVANASVTIARSTPVLTDVFSMSSLYNVNLANLIYRLSDNLFVGTLSSSVGILQIDFNVQPVMLADIQDTLRNVVFNPQSYPEDNITLVWTYNDGNTDGSQGEGGEMSFTTTETLRLSNGILISQQCVSVDLVGTYTDGVGGVYTEVIESNSPSCVPGLTLSTDINVAPGDPLYQQVELLMPLDNDLLDHGPKNHTVDVHGSAAIDNSSMGNSLKITNSSDYLSIPDWSDWTSSDWTVEATMCFPQAISSDNNNLITVNNNAYPNRYALDAGAVDANTVNVRIVTDSNALLYSANTTQSLNTAIKLAYVNNATNNTFNIYANGIQVGTCAPAMLNPTPVLQICKSSDAWSNETYYVKDLRITFAARYTADYAPEPYLQTPICTVSGVVKDANNSFCARTLHLYLQSDMTLLDSTSSNAVTGEYELTSHAQADCVLVLYADTNQPGEVDVTTVIHF